MQVDIILASQVACQGHFTPHLPTEDGPAPFCDLAMSGALDAVRKCLGINSVSARPANPVLLLASIDASNLERRTKARRRLVYVYVAMPLVL